MTLQAQQPEVNIIRVALQGFTDVIRDEVNVKEVRLVDLGTADEAGFGLTQRLVVNARVAGPRLGRDVQTVIKAS